MKIKCVDNTLCSTLTLDKEYLVIEEAPEYYVVLDDVNNETTCKKSRFVIQRVNHAKCTIDGNITGSIEKGLCVLIGIAETDTKEIADKMIKKLINMRIFADENDKTNLSINDVDGKLLLISQFTLYANCKKGNRPSFVEAGSPDMANELYEYCISECDKAVPGVQRGVFGADMKIELENDGPFTIVLDSDKL